MAKGTELKLENIDSAYERDDKDANKQGTESSREHRLVFRQHLEGDHRTGIKR